MTTTKELSVNGARHRVQVESGEPLLEVLRDRLGLTGTKYGCGEGQCGACTVWINGRATRSCRLPVELAVGTEIRTIEGLSRDPRFHALQNAFLEAGALQCGYCTSGMVMSAAALLNRTQHPDRATILAQMQGNVCRCGTFQRIIAAIEHVNLKKGGTSHA